MFSWLKNKLDTLPCLIVGGSNRLKWVAFSENNRPKTKNYTLVISYITLYIQVIKFSQNRGLPPPPPP